MQLRPEEGMRVDAFLGLCTTYLSPNMEQFINIINIPYVYNIKPSQPKMKQFLIGFCTFFCSKDESGIKEISKEEYLDFFVNGRKLEDKEKILNIAWEARRVVIDNYWKRASYYWAFQVAAFAGYFTVLGSNAYSETPQVLFRNLYGMH